MLSGPLNLLNLTNKFRFQNLQTATLGVNCSVIHLPQIASTQHFMSEYNDNEKGAGDAPRPSR